MLALDRGIGLAHRPQSIEPGVTFGTVIFVERHNPYILSPLGILFTVTIVHGLATAVKIGASVASAPSSLAGGGLGWGYLLLAVTFCRLVCYHDRERMIEKEGL